MARTCPTSIGPGSTVRSARLRAGLTQQQLADLAGLKYRTSVNHIERGRWTPSPRLLARLLAACADFGDRR